MTSETAEHSTTSPTEDLRTWMGREVHRLQAGYRKDLSLAVATLAQLRRAGRTGAIQPEVWEFLQTLPDSCVGRGDAPSRQERAAATTIGLYSIHQQSKRTRPMHVNDVSLGRALRQLSPGADIDPALMRSVKVLLSADDYDEVIHHLRGLVQRLRSADIGLDYGQLAADLSRVGSAAQDDVRRRWARDFYVRSRPAETADQTDDQHDNETGADQ